ncbi:MAG: pyridine nucleotide-disulfide oxidoreductase, partial [Nocardioidaceae bacterium]
MTTATDLYGLTLSTSSPAAEAYNRGVGALLRVQEGAFPAISESVAHDPTFALGHCGLALLGHEYSVGVHIEPHLDAAERHSRRATDRERSHVHAVSCHIAGDSRPLVAHLSAYPADALLLSVAVPTIAFAGVTQVPQEAWAIVERAEPAYGSDWWYSGLLAFIRQEQHRWDDAMRLACRSLDTEPQAGHSVHARTHVHYETGDHQAGRDWLDGWIHGPGETADNLAHFSWHAALHELSMGDFEAVRTRYSAELAPPTVFGCRALVDSCSLLWRWAITPGSDHVPEVEAVLADIDADLVDTPPTPFVAMHAAVTLCAVGDSDRLDRLDAWARTQPDPTYAEVVSPLAEALQALAAGDPSQSADLLQGLLCSVWRLGGSEAQREVVEDTLIAALLAAGRYDEARPVIDHRLDRRESRR